MFERNPISDFVAGPLVGISALYCLTFPNGKRYVGISTNPRKRLRLHKRYALRGSQFAVHKAIRKFGIESVKQDIILIGPTPYVLEMEAKVIAAFQSRNMIHGYNMAAGGNANPMADPIARAKMIRSLTGRKESDEVRAKKRASWTPERRAAMSALHKGKTISDEQKLANSILHTGRVVSAESRKKNGDARRGIPRPDYVKAKISKTLKDKAKK